MANRNNNDSYDELLMKLSADKGVQFARPESEVKNNGEIYFSPNSGTGGSVPSTDAPAPRRASAGSTAKKAPAKKTDSSKASGTKNTSKKKKSKKKKKARVGAALAKILVIIALIVVLAFIIKIPLMRCINDVLALDGTAVEHRVTLTETMEYDEVIDLLCEKKLLNNAPFCKLVAKFMDFDDPRLCYAPGDYNLSTSMGVEGMLQEIAHAGNQSNTVTLTFPEGFTADKIAEKLELNGVCSKKGFYTALTSDTIYEQYDILKDIDRSGRYYGAEGYLYPDTYEFYVGEDPFSVVSRFLNNFVDKWNDEYTERAKSLGYSMDEIITVASILEKEAKDSEQMSLIASILYNRLDSPSAFPFINCDSTAAYIENSKETINDTVRYEALLANYDTYTVTGLPAGPISNPGADSIYAALHPDNTSYYYFLHDSEGKIYVAKTADEHQANAAYLN